MDEQIASNRLLLRKLSSADIPSLAKAADDALIAKMLGLPSPYTQEHAKQYVMISLQKWEEAKSYNLAIVSKDDPTTILGMISLMDFDQPRYKAEVGYWMSAAGRSQGLMTEAVAILTDYAFTKLGLQRLEGRVDADNLASQTVLKKNGFTLEGNLRRRGFRGEKRFDEYWFGLLRSEWST